MKNQISVKKVNEKIEDIIFSKRLLFSDDIELSILVDQFSKFFEVDEYEGIDYSMIFSELGRHYDYWISSTKTKEEFQEKIKQYPSEVRKVFILLSIE